jgi:hypothetical protein
MPDDQPARFAADKPSAKAGAARSADWRAETPGAAGNRTVLAVLSLLALLAIAGVVIGFFAFWFGAKPEPRLVFVPVGEYDHPAWPVNPWANQDARRLADCFPDRWAVEFESQERIKFRQLLDRLAVPVAGPARPLVLHVTALAAVRDRKVYLLPGDAQPGDPASWVAVEELLDAFDRAAADRGKLLVLDLAHPIADPFSGVLRDEVSDRLHDLLEARSAALPFPVLTSCGPGEESLPADAERCSGFALYLAEGLQGAADGCLSVKLDQGRDGEVTPSELRAFLSGRVSRWARLVHERRQEPRLYGPADRGPVFRVPPSPPAQTDPPAPDPYPPSLADGWRFRGELRTTGADLGLPVPFARLTAALVRAEQVWLRSGDAARIERNLGGARNDWQEALKKSGGTNRAADVYAKALDAVGKYRLAVARRGRPDAPDDWKPPLDQYLTAKATVAKDKPDESGKFRDEWLKKVQPEKARENRLDAADLLWDRFPLAPPTAERAKAAAAALDDLKAAAAGDPKAGLGYSETVLLRSLAAWDPRRQSISRYPGDLVKDLVRAEEELSQALALGPNGFELVRGQLDKAKESYQAGQKNLFRGSFGDLEQAGRQLKEAADGFAAAREALERWQQAGRELDAAVVAVIDTMPSALTAPEPEFDRWLAKVRAVTALADQIAPAGRDRTLDQTQLAAASRTAGQTPLVVRDPFAVPAGKKEPDPLAPRAKPDDVLPLLRLVAGTALPAESRRKVWDTIRADARAFHEAARKRDADDAAANDPPTNPVPADEKERVGEDKLAVRRARASVELLKLAGYTKAGELDAALGRLERNPTSDAEPLGRLLRAAWAEGLPAQAKAAAAAGRPHEADRIVRAIPPGAVHLWPADAIIAADPSSARDTARAYRVWARDQLLADKELRPPTAAATEFYEAVRQDLDLGPD